MAGDARIKHFIEEEVKPAIRNVLPKLVESIKLFEDLAGLNGTVARNNAEDIVKVRVEQLESQEEAALEVEKEAKQLADENIAAEKEEKRIAEAREKAANEAEAKVKGRAGAKKKSKAEQPKGKK